MFSGLSTHPLWGAYGSYIKYSADDVKIGDTMETVLVYNPSNNHIDDVMYRADTFLE